MPRRGSYLFKRKGSQNWWIRFQYTGALRVKFGSKKEVSLGTPHRDEAEIRALDYIAEHKLLLFTHKHIKQLKENTVSDGLEFEPNKLIVNPEGGHILTTEHDVTYFNGSGILIDKQPNRKMVKVNFRVKQQDFQSIEQFISKSSDDTPGFIGNWINYRSLSKHIEREVKSVWNDLSIITNNKSIENITRDDIRKLIDALSERGNRAATINKKLGHLRAACNYALEEGMINKHPFRKMHVRLNDELQRLPLSSKDMLLVRSHLDELRSEDQALWILLATTGMRLSEPFAVREEFEVDGVRYIRVGSKTSTSRRRVPIPSCLLTTFPNEIKGPMFPGDPEVAGKRIRYFLRRIGISYNENTKTGDERKVIHSLRHRAKDRLRELKCPLEVQYEILGHEIETEARGYGIGSPMKDLLRWIDDIGY